MIVFAHVPCRLHARLRTALGIESVHLCDSAAALVAQVRQLGGGIAVVDPLLHGASGLTDVVGTCAARRVPVVLYTDPVAPSIKPCFAWARAGARKILLAGIDDSPEQLRKELTALPTGLAAEALLDRLEERLTRLPAELVAAVRQLFLEPTSIGDLDQFAARACMTRRSVDRWIRRARLAPAKRLMGAARLTRFHAALAGGERSLERAAERAGFSSMRSLAFQSRTLLGAHPAWLRGVESTELHERLARYLCDGWRSAADGKPATDH